MQFCSHLVTLLSITYLHLIRYPLYNHPCNLPTSPPFVWTHEIHGRDRSIRDCQEPLPDEVADKNHRGSASVML